MSSAGNDIAQQQCNDDRDQRRRNRYPAWQDPQTCRDGFAIRRRRDVGLANRRHRDIRKGRLARGVRDRGKRLPADGQSYTAARIGARN